MNYLIGHLQASALRRAQKGAYMATEQPVTLATHNDDVVRKTRDRKKLISDQGFGMSADSVAAVLRKPLRIVTSETVATIKKGVSQWT